jgi:hypothetical protein
MNALVLGQSHQSPTKRLGDTATPRDKHVYFNSAGFNGYQFLTDTAKNAGYATRSFKPDSSLNENGLASIVEQDVRNMIESAENTLLRILVKDSTARSVVKNMLTARQAVNFGGDIKWSTSDKQWLFDLLVYGVDASSDTCITESDRYELRYVLAHHPTVPPGAFSPMDVEPIAQQATLMSSSDLAPTDKLDRADALVELAQIDENSEKKDLSRKLQSSIGTLDTFFEDEIITNERFIHDDIIEGTRNELAVQETLVSLLWASAALKSKNIQAELVSYSKSLNENNLLKVKKIGDSSNAAKNHILAGSIEEAQSIDFVENADQQLRNIASTVMNTNEVEDEIFTFDKYQSELLTQLRDTTCTLHALKESSNRIALRLLDESSSTGVEGSISHSLQVDLASKLDDHVRDVLQYDLYPEPGINDIPYEIELERMAEEWGDWYDDDYVWTPGESSKVSTMNQLTDNQVVLPESDIDQETLEDFFERVDREWNGWDS